MSRLGIIAALFVTTLTVAAHGETITLSCNLASHIETTRDSLADTYLMVNEIFIDTDAPSFALLVSNGTIHKELFSFVYVGASCPKPQIQVIGDTISGSQQCGAPIGFFYFKGLHQFMLSRLYIGRGEIIVWNCL